MKRIRQLASIAAAFMSVGMCDTGALADGSSLPVMVYSPRNDAAPPPPVYRLFSGAGWSAAANLPASVLPSSWVVVRNCPVVDATACV
ncbi:MAG: hypothetical protein ACOYN0_11305, partial [Phycisphaerales bacterium]